MTFADWIILIVGVWLVVDLYAAHRLRQIADRRRSRPIDEHTEEFWH
jgi:hypothetical protein